MVSGCAAHPDADEQLQEPSIDGPETATLGRKWCDFFNRLMLRFMGRILSFSWMRAGCPQAARRQRPPSTAGLLQPWPSLARQFFASLTRCPTSPSALFMSTNAIDSIFPSKNGSTSTVLSSSVRIRAASPNATNWSVEPFPDHPGKLHAPIRIQAYGPIRHPRAYPRGSV